MNNRRWLHANIYDRKSAESILLSKGFDGSYLVRRSKSSTGDFSLSVRRGDKVVHVKIKYEEDGYAVSGGETFASLSELISCYANGLDELQEKNGSIIHLKQPLNCMDPTNERWYHGRITREDADKILMDSGNLDAFLVRESNSKPGDYVICVRNDINEISNILVRFANDEYCVPGSGDYPRFDTITELVDYYRDQPLVTADRKVLKLTKPVNTTRINIIAINDRVEAMKNDRDHVEKGGFSEEFESLQKYDVSLPCSQGRKPENVPKNRYKNILPFDQTRVVLTDGILDKPGSDYINANYLHMNEQMRPPDDGSRYIATQGCLQTTVDDFWRMVWQENSRIIVMLTKLVERSKNKCIRYWPDEFDEKRDVLLANNQRLRVTMNESLRNAASDYEVHVLKVDLLEAMEDEMTRIESRLIYHYHFLTWPDKSVPKNPAPLLEFVRDYERRKSEFTNMGPTVVHCSAGIGRTGAFIVIDALLRQISRYGLECEVDIQKTVEEARQQRSGMVQTEEQYKFIYTVLQHYIETHRARVVAQHVTTDTLPQEYSNLYFTQTGLQRSASVPFGHSSSSRLNEPMYANANATNHAQMMSRQASAQPIYENSTPGNR